MTIEPGNKTAWCFMKPRGRPSYTHAMMSDIATMQHDLATRFSRPRPDPARPLEWFVMASATPGIFNLGGDLAHFADRIQAGDLAALRHYGHVAVEAIFRNTEAFGLPMLTIALVQGDALGGGFEHALSFDMIVAERSAKFGLPEILFNMFPGMGAMSFLSRRIGRAQAEALIMSGRIHTAEELHAMGVVDVLAEDGQGEDTVRAYIAQHSRKHNALYSFTRARRRINPVTLEELREVVDIWAEAALNLTPPDLRKMARLTAAQDRRLATPAQDHRLATPAQDRRLATPAQDRRLATPAQDHRLATPASTLPRQAQVQAGAGAGAAAGAASVRPGLVALDGGIAGQGPRLARQAGG